MCVSVRGTRGCGGKGSVSAEERMAGRYLERGWAERHTAPYIARHKRTCMARSSSSSSPRRSFAGASDIDLLVWRPAEPFLRPNTIAAAPPAGPVRENPSNRFGKTEMSEGLIFFNRQQRHTLHGERGEVRWVGVDEGVAFDGTDVEGVRRKELKKEKGAHTHTCERHL